jgi:hypothetical protein
MGVFNYPHESAGGLLARASTGRWAMASLSIVCATKRESVVVVNDDDDNIVVVVETSRLL